MSATPERTESPRHVRLLWGVLAGAMLFNHRTLFEQGDGRAHATLDAALFDPNATSPALGCLVFAGLVFARRAEIRTALSGATCIPIALPCLLLGLGLLGWSHRIGAPDLVLPALVLELVGGAAWLGGRALVAKIGFPLLALVCVFQLPPILLNRLFFPLQLGTVALTSGLLSLIGRAHAVAGDLILTDGATFQVIEGCSGLKTILSLMLAAVAYAEVVRRRGVEKIVLLAIAPVIGFLVNGLRVLVLVLRRVPAESPEHQLYGILAIVVGVALLALVEVGLSRTIFRGSAPPESVAEGARPAGRRVRLAVAACASAAISIGLLLGWPGPLRRPDVRLPNIEELPLELSGREARGLRIDDGFLGSVRFAHRIYRAYEAPGEAAIRVFVGLADPESRSFSAISPKTAIPHSGWLALERLEPLVRDRESGLEREQLMLRYDPHFTGDRSLGASDAGGGAGSTPSERNGVGRRRAAKRVLVEHVRLGFAPWEVELLETWLGLDRLRTSGTSNKLVIRVEADVGDDPAESELSLRQFVQEVVSWYRNPG